MRRLGCKGTSEAGADGNAAGHRSKPNLCGLKVVGWQKILNMEWNTAQIICWSLKVAKRMRYEAMPHLVDIGKWSASVAQLMCLCLCICICRCLFVDQNEIRSYASSGGSCQVERQCGSANVSLSLYLYLSLSFCWSEWDTKLCLIWWILPSGAPVWLS